MFNLFQRSHLLGELTKLSRWLEIPLYDLGTHFLNISIIEQENLNFKQKCASL